MQYAKEMAEFVKKYEGVPPVRVFFDSFGDFGTIRWIVDYDDLAALEKVRDQMIADEAFHQRLEQTPDLFIDGNIQDIVMREI